MTLAFVLGPTVMARHVDAPLISLDVDGLFAELQHLFTLEFNPRIAVGLEAEYRRMTADRLDWYAGCYRGMTDEDGAHLGLVLSEIADRLASFEENMLPAEGYQDSWDDLGLADVVGGE